MSQIRLFHTVAQQILQLIADEGFGPGAKLPGERELAERFGVSRVTVREAEVALQAQGRLTIETLWRMRTEQPQVRAVHAAVCEQDDSSRVEEHAAILDALKAHDPAGARRAMRSHFNRLLSAMLDASARTAMQELERQVAASRERFLISTLTD